MPNNDKLLTEEQIAQMEAAGQVAPVEAPPIVPGVNNGTGAPPTPSGRDQYNSGALPPNFGLQPDLVKTGYGGGMGEIRLMPVEGGPGANAKTAGIATKIVNDAIAGLPGPVTPPTPVGDGIVHGNPIWWIDPAFFWWRDDFMFGTSGAAASTIAGSGVTVITQIGDSRLWDLTLGAGAGEVTSKNQGGPPNPGMIVLATGTSASTASALFFSTGASSANQGGVGNAALSLLDNPGWEMVWVFKLSTFRITSAASSFPPTQKSLYIGISTANGTSVFNPGNGVNPRPPFFYGLRFDTDTTAPAIGDSTFHFEVVANPVFGSTRNNTQGSTANTSIVPLEDVWYQFRMEMSAAGQIVMTLTGGGATFTSTFNNVPTLSSNSTNSQSITLVRNNGLGQISYAGQATAGTSNFVWGTGSIITISGEISKPFYNGTFTILYPQGNSTGAFFALAGASDLTPSSGVTITGYPVVMPYAGWGNDTQATPTTMSLAIDFFSMVWNGGIAGIPQNPNNSRYY